MSEKFVESKTVYYDTNVISYVNAGQVPDFLDGLLKLGFRSVISDTVLEELPTSIRSEIQSRHLFQYVYAHEAFFFPEGSLKLFSNMEPPNHTVGVDRLENFLRGLLRSVAGSSSVPELNSLFRDGIRDVFDSILEDLPEGSDARLIDQLAQARRKFLESMEGMPAIHSPVVTKEEISNLQLGPKYLGNVRPPGVVAKVIEVCPGGSDWLDSLLAPFKADEDIKSRIQELCVALILVGFSRDKGIANDDQKKSDDGARSQFHDISHICAAAVCDLFITADKRCARLAFSVYEALKIRTDVLHLILGNPNEVKVRLVGQDYWP